MKQSLLTALFCALSMTLLAMTQQCLHLTRSRLFLTTSRCKCLTPSASYLKDNLDLYRWRGNERMNEGQLQRLVSLAPAQIRELLITEGFYSPPSRQKPAIKRTNGWCILQLIPACRFVVAALIFKSAALSITARQKTGHGLKKYERTGACAPMPYSGTRTGKKPNAMHSSRCCWKTSPLHRLATAGTGQPGNHVCRFAGRAGQRPAVYLGALEISGLERYPATLVERMNPSILVRVTPSANCWSFNLVCRIAPIFPLRT